MKIVPSQYVAGCPVGQVAEVEDRYGRWLITNGYATAAKTEETSTSKSEATSGSTADDDSTAQAPSAAPTTSSVEPTSPPTAAPQRSARKKGSSKR